MGATLSIIVVSFNTLTYTLKCLVSVFESLKFGKLEQDSEVIVVDNASKDKTEKEIRTQFPQVKLIINKKNKGFAAANNQALSRAKGELILLLNSDTILSRDTLAKMVSRITEDPKIGVLGCKLLNTDGSLQQSFGYLPRLSRIGLWMLSVENLHLFSPLIKPYHAKGESLYQKERDVGWISGAFFLIKRDVVKKAGFLDEHVFMYGEEVEWCYRISKAGFKVLFTPIASVIHHKGASSIGADAGIVEEYKTMMYLFGKHKPSWEMPILRILLSFGALLRIVLFGIIARYEKRIPYYKKALLVAWG